MMSLSEAQAEAAKWGNLIRALSRLQEAAESLGALEQNRAERQAEVDRLGDDIATAGAHLEDLHEQIAQAKTQRVAILEQAQAQAAEFLEKAQRETDRLLAQAHAQMKEAQTDVMAAQAELQAAQSLRAQAEEAASQAESRLVAARAAARAVIED